MASTNSLRARNVSRALALATTLLLVVSCRDATQITLHVHTNLPCTSEEQWKGVAVYVGEPGADVESTSATLVTHSCDESGQVGSLVVVPSGAKDGDVGIRVVAGVVRDPEKCQAYDYDGCIVARRALHFTPHRDLELEVALTADCVGFGCDPERTCLTGGCVDTSKVESRPQPPGPLSGPVVHCGANDAVCAARSADATPGEGEVCCLTVNAEAGTSSGACVRDTECPTGSIVLNCDDDSDCPAQDDAGFVGLCALSYAATDGNNFAPKSIALSTCAFANHDSINSSGYGLALCEARTSCAHGQFFCRESEGDPNLLPGYFWCRITVP